MLKTIMKRTLSMLLALVFIYTTFCFADLGLFASARQWMHPVNTELEPEIHLYMPEAIYLDPADASSPYDFKYFVDTTSDGTPNANAAQTSGLIYFDCTELCSSIELVYDTTEVVLSTSSSSVVAPAAVTNSRSATWEIESGSTTAKRGTVTVTLKYRISGEDFDRYLERNIYMYGMRMNATMGAGTIYEYQAIFSNPRIGCSFLLGGLHKVGGGVHTPYTSTTANTQTTSVLVGDIAVTHRTLEDKNYPSETVLGYTSTAYDRSEGDGYSMTGTNVNSGSPNGGGFRWFGKVKSNNDENNPEFVQLTNSNGDKIKQWELVPASPYPVGRITVDASRHADFSSVPFLQSGFILFGSENTDTAHSFQMLGESTGSGTVYAFTGIPSGQSFAYNDKENGYYYGAYHASGTVPPASTSAATTTDYLLKSAFTVDHGACDETTVYLDMHMTVTSVNKSALREAVKTAYTKAWTDVNGSTEMDTADKMELTAAEEAEWSTLYTTFDDARIEATTVLGDPEATAAQITAKTTALNNAMDAVIDFIEGDPANNIEPHFVSDADTTMFNTGTQPTFLVPETIYLQPTVVSAVTHEDNGETVIDQDAYNTFSVGQYFYGVNTSGVVSADMKDRAPDTGNYALLYWSGDGADNVKITARLSSHAWNAATDKDNIGAITEIDDMGTAAAAGDVYTIAATTAAAGTAYSGTTMATTGLTAFKANGASSTTYEGYLKGLTLASALSPGTYKFIEWRATYTKGNQAYTQYAYTAVYAPYDLPVVAAARQYNAKRSKLNTESLAWIVGLSGAEIE